jgi:hypothetical protein
MSVLDSNPHIHITKCIGQLPGVLPAIGWVGAGGKLNSVPGAEGMAETGAVKWHSDHTCCGSCGDGSAGVLNSSAVQLGTLRG